MLCRLKSAFANKLVEFWIVIGRNESSCGGSLNMMSAYEQIRPYGIINWQ